MMLHYSVIDKRLRTYLGQVEGLTHDQCVRNAKSKYERDDVRIDCYPAPPEYKGPSRAQLEAIEGKVAEVIELRPAERTIKDILDDPLYAHFFDGRHMPEEFGFDHEEAIVVHLGAAEIALSMWAKEVFELSDDHGARVFQAGKDLVVVVSKTGQ